MHYYYYFCHYKYINQCIGVLLNKVCAPFLLDIVCVHIKEVDSIIVHTVVKNSNFDKQNKLFLYEVFLNMNSSIKSEVFYESWVFILDLAKLILFKILFINQHILSNIFV